MRLIDKVAQARGGGKAFVQPPFWAGDGLSQAYLLPSSLSSGREKIEANFDGYIQGAYKSSGVVFACMLVRQWIFAEARFQWREFRQGRPGELFGSPDLALLEEPWPSGTTGELLARMDAVSVLAGNYYSTVADDEGRLGRAARGERRIVHMRPDWTTIIIDSASGNPNALDARVVGFDYQPPPSGNGAPTESVLLLPNECCHYCVDEETTILTTGGWKTADTLAVGDEALTLNHETGLTEWQPVSDVCVFPNQTREMLSLEGKEHSSLTTLSHRWAVERKNSRAGEYVRRWATSETLSTGDRIPVAGYSADLPEQPKYSDALVEAIAWFWTEGCIKRRNGQHTRAVSISQSVVVNEDNVARIRVALRTLFGDPVADQTLTHRVPRWQESRSGNNAIFHLSSAAGDVLTEHAPGKVVTTQFLRSLTRAQLDLFIKASMLADNDGPTRLAQKNRAAAEQFALACLLAGHGVTIRQRKVNPKYGYGMWVVRILRKRHTYPQESKRERAAFQARIVRHEGRVWCPRTPNQTWLARRNGAVYFTGNSPIPDPAARFRGMSPLTPIVEEIRADRAATKHKGKFFENGAVHTHAVSFAETDPDKFARWVEMYKAEHRGVDNAYKQLFLGGGADVTPLGVDFRQLDFKATQGASETRIAAVLGVHPVVAALSEGMQGSSLNAGNFQAACRLTANRTMRPLWRMASASLQRLVTPPRRGAHLWYDDRDIAFLHEDATDLAEIRSKDAQTLRTLVDGGFNPDAAVEFVATNDLNRLKGSHSGLLPVQLQPPGSGEDQSRAELNGRVNGPQAIQPH